MKKLITILAITGAIASTGCSNPEPVVKPKQIISTLDTLIYVMDTKTGLCFAKIISPTYYGDKTTSIICVPCDSLRKIHMDTLK